MPNTKYLSGDMNMNPLVEFHSGQKKAAETKTENCVVT